MTSKPSIREALAEACGDEPILFLDPPEIYNQAIIGLAEFWGPTKSGGSQRVIAVAYDTDKILKALQKDGMSLEEAEEWFDFNTAGAYVGEHTPVFVKVIK